MTINTFLTRWLVLTTLCLGLLGWSVPLVQAQQCSGTIVCCGLWDYEPPGCSPQGCADKNSYCQGGPKDGLICTPGSNECDSGGYSYACVANCTLCTGQSCGLDLTFSCAITGDPSDCVSYLPGQAQGCKGGYSGDCSWSSGGSTCGDGVCGNPTAEGCAICPQDCSAYCAPVCGDGACNASSGETCGSCSTDCGSCAPYCGDTSCNNGETCGSCAADCGSCSGGGPVCGNGQCEGTENCSNCAGDCGACSVCGNGTCGAGENCGNCVADCGSCQVCGNGTCGGSENCSNCSADCGACGGCGDLICNNGETCLSCAGDCGACGGPTCGDGSCNGMETCTSCVADCGACSGTFCGDGACNGFESCLSCDQDCGVCSASQAWWQTQGGSVFSASPDGVALQSLIPATCVSPTCIAALITEDAASTDLSDGFVMTGGGSTNSNGYSTERQPGILVTGTRNNKFKEGYTFFTREYDFGQNPSDDWAGSANNALKPSSAPSGGKLAYFHDSTANGTLTIQNAWAVGAGEKIVVIVKGDLLITNPSGTEQLISVAQGGFLSFIVSGTITIDDTVGNNASSTTTSNLEGIFIADGQIVVESSGDTATEKRFVGAGSWVGWSGLDLNRDLGVTTNETIPAEQFVFRPDFMVNTPSEMARPRYVWQETN